MPGITPIWTKNIYRFLPIRSDASDLDRGTRNQRAYYHRQLRRHDPFLYPDDA